MLTRLRTPLAAAAIVLATALSLACDEAAPGAAAGDISLREGPGSGGPVFNTWKLFTSDVSAVDTQGQELGGVKLGSVELVKNGLYYAIDANSLSVDHGKLEAEIGGVGVSGFDFEGSRWTFSVGELELQAYLTTVETADDAGLHDPGSTIDLRKLDPERLVYTFTWYDGAQTPHATCKEDDVGGARTVIYGDIVVDHTTGDISARPDTLYLGCISGSVGKAALWGYAPDSPSTTSLSLPAFETATRMVRADYCANGGSYTDVGNEVVPRDRWQINDYSVLGFTTEAVWETGGGAKCLKRIRKTGVTLLGPHACPNGGPVIPLCAGDATLTNRWNNYGYGNFWTKIP